MDPTNPQNPTWTRPRVAESLVQDGGEGKLKRGFGQLPVWGQGRYIATGATAATVPRQRGVPRSLGTVKTWTFPS